MRVLLLLLVLAVVGVTLAQWLGSKPPNPLAAQETAVPNRLMPPTLPTRPQDLKGFEKDINQFVQDGTKQQARQIERREK